LRRSLAAAEKRIAELTAAVEKLKAALEEAQRSAKHQAAPFRKAEGPQPDPKKPGRKSGRRHGRHAHRSPPPRIDERYDVPLPAACPHCGRRHLTETGQEPQCWRVAGSSAWLHDFVGATATCYEIGDRSGDAAQGLLGSEWSGTLIRDGWSVYNRFQSASHQLCLAHLKRRCERLLETAVGAAARLRRRILELIDVAFALRRAWRGHRLSRDALAEAGLVLGEELDRLADGRFRHAPNRRLAAHVRAHALHWFWFLIDPTIDATNYRAEQAIRPAVVNRKVWGGNRTWPGARAQAVLLSVLRTLGQRGHQALAWFSHLRRSPAPLPLPAPGR
jgi:transposase